MTRGADKRHNGKRGNSGFVGRFVAIPEAVYLSPPFIALSPWAIKLMIDLIAQYNGKNNGDLTTAWKIIQPRGWHSETTLHKAKKELIAAGFIIEMRKGKRPKLCSLFALTWRPLNPSPKHDFGPNGFQPHAYLQKSPVVLTLRLKTGGASLTPSAVVCGNG